MHVGQLITKKCFIDKSGFHNLCHENISKRIILMNFFLEFQIGFFLHWNIRTIRIVDCCDCFRWACMWGEINGKLKKKLGGGCEDLALEYEVDFLWKWDWHFSMLRWHCSKWDWHYSMLKWHCFKLGWWCHLWWQLIWLLY